MGLHPTKKLLHSRRNYQQNEKATNEWKKIFTNDIFAKVLISKIHKEVTETQHQKNKQTDFKIGRIL